MRWLLVLAACSSPAARITAPPPQTPPMPERALAPSANADPPAEFRLPRHFVPVSHEVELSLHHTALDGTMRITGDVVSEASVIWLHAIALSIYRVTATHEGQTIELAVARQPKTETIALVSPTPFSVGRWTLAIEYRAQVSDHGEVPVGGSYVRPELAARGAFSQLVAGKRYTFTNFEPMDARRVVPCIDEPDRKIPWQLTLEVPRDSIAISNTAIVRRLERGARTRYEFAPTRPLPSYLFAFAVGPFEIVDAGVSKSRAPIRILVPAGSTADARAVAKWPAIAFDKIESWFEIPYPYGKIDLVAVPRTGPGWHAMENPGLVTFEVGLLREPTSLVQVLEHEFAHQWFGNLVTLAWWDDIWLNEAFATWLAAKLPIDGVPPDPPLDPQRYDGHERVDAPRTIRPPKHAVTDRTRLAPYFAGHVGEPLVASLERFLGETVFRDALRNYLRARSDSVATSIDLANELATAFGHPITAMVLHALDGGPPPAVSLRPTCSRKPTLNITREGDVPTVACFAFDDGGKRADRCVLVEDTPVALPLRSCPRWILPEPRRSDLVRFSFDKKDLRAVLDHVWTLLDPSEQAALLDYKFDDVSELELVTRLVDSPDVAARERAALWLVRFSYNLPDDLLPAFERRVRAQYTELARSNGLDGKRAIGAVRLLATIGDPVLGRQAVERLAKSPAEHLWVYGLAIHADRGRLEAILASDDAPGWAYTAIGLLPDALDIVASHPKLTSLRAHQILVARCNPQRRDAIQRMPELDDTIRKRAIAAIDVCLPTGKVLEPVFRRWLAK